MAFAAALASITAVSHAETAEACYTRITGQLDALLKKDQPKLFAWHLRSLRALAQTEYAKLLLNLDQRGHTADARQKEFIEAITTISKGLDGDCSNPDQALKNGRRNLILARPSDIDGSLQYMMVDLPKNWDPEKQYPLWVGLHGTGPDYPLAYPSYGFGPLGAEKQTATSNMIRLAPWGRGNRGWRADAERDMFEAIAQLQTFCKLDPDRWYLTGHSAGADGTWAIIQHTPDLWASAGLQSGSMLSGRPEWGLIPNMTYLPVHILIGENDNLPSRIPDSKEAYRILKEAGDETELVILPGIGHYPLTEAGFEEQAVWMTKFVRKRPSKFSFTVDQSEHPGVWGIRVPAGRGSRFIKEPWPTFSCEITGQEVKITAKNLTDLTVDLGPSGLRMSGDVQVILNGKKVHGGPIPARPLSLKVN